MARAPWQLKRLLQSATLAMCHPSGFRRKVSKMPEAGLCGDARAASFQGSAGGCCDLALSLDDSAFPPSPLPFATRSSFLFLSLFILVHPHSYFHTPPRQLDNLTTPTTQLDRTFANHQHRPSAQSKNPLQIRHLRVSPTTPYSHPFGSACCLLNGVSATNITHLPLTSKGCVALSPGVQSHG